MPPRRRNNKPKDDEAEELEGNNELLDEGQMFSFGSDPPNVSCVDGPSGKDYQGEYVELDRELRKIQIETKMLELEQRKLNICQRMNEIRPYVKAEDPAQKTITDSNELKVPDNIPISVNNSDLPKVEITYYYGDPASYWSFIKEFESNVANRISDDALKLSYLKYYCRGDARKAVEGCCMLPAKEGYSLAMHNLKELFGNDYKVSRALMESIKRDIREVKDTSVSWNLLSLKLKDCLTTFVHMNKVHQLDSFETLESLVKCLPEKVRDKWIELSGKIERNGSQPRFEDLANLVSDCACYNTSSFHHLASKPRREYPSKYDKPRDRNVLALTRTPKKPPVVVCPKCSGSHRLDKCENFLKLAVDERISFVKSNGRCFMCLGGNHLLKDCRFKHPCPINGCNRLHSRLLHLKESTSGQSSTPNCVALTSKTQSVQLGLIPVHVCSHNGTLVTYALLDPGSEITLIKNSLAQKLALHGQQGSLNLRTVSGDSSLKTQRVSLSVRSLDNTEVIELNDVFTVNSLPIREVTTPSGSELKKWDHLRDIEITTCGKGDVGILIGSDVPEAHWVLDQRLGNRKEPFAIRTLLGWIIRGPSDHSSSPKSVNNITSSNKQLDTLITRLYNTEFEDIADERLLSQDDLTAVNLVNSSTRFEAGHYIIGLPWKFSSKSLPDNKSLAWSRLNYLKKRLLSDRTLYERYTKVIENYLTEGYAREVPLEQLRCSYLPRWFLPHHPVLNPKKPDKVRVVFDCAAQFKNVSLNQCLYSGPNVVSDLVGVIMRFRERYIALVADIKEMFLQVRVQESDTGALRFLWWPKGDLSVEPKEYQLLVHLFGATSSPYCANYALQKTASDFSSLYGFELKNVVKDNFYVDDCLLSIDDRNDAKRIITNLVAMLKEGGFLLTKWISNDPSLLSDVSSTSQQNSVITLDPECSSQRTLGLLWNFHSDTFQISSCEGTQQPTKRSILSQLASVFDPLGFVAPFIFPGKILFQEMCRKKKGWDDPLSEDAIDTYMLWRKTLNSLNSLEIPRCIKPKADVKRFELHVFADASELGYGAVAYLLSVTTEHKRYSTILMSKSRVAPLKSVPIPRLELTAAVLATRLAAKIKRECRIKIDSTTFWTDSMIVLFYINNSSTRYRTFVANRLTELRSASNPNQWKHVPGLKNPADATSRIVKCDDRFLETWTKGPAFLLEPEDAWPKQPSELSVDRNLIEQKKSQGIVLTVVRKSSLHELITHFSSWVKILRVIAWMTRFKTYVQAMFGKRQECSLLLGPLKLHEVRNAEHDLIKLVQFEAFNEELTCLSKGGKSVPKTSKIYKLNPILVDNILYISSRISGSKINAPIIFPNDHPLTGVLISFYHSLEGHSGTAHTLNSLRSKFWIIKGQRTVRNTLSKCVICRKITAKPCSQLMAKLPESRFTCDNIPFSTVGLDYFGPFLVKHRRSLEKRYVCLFTCLKIRAVHLEMTHSLSTESFLMALTRFMGRRGIPRTIYSDNGTNLVGAESILKECIMGWSRERIDNQMIKLGIEWVFNPPECSHRGGVWERMIRATRRILRAITYKQTLTDETLLTFLVEAERILNSRPICPLSDDPKDPIALTPAMILLLRDNTVEMSEHHGNINLRCWRHACNIASAFWKRWIREYLTTLHLRQKWTKHYRNLKAGDVVLLLSESSTNKEWPLGLIVDTKLDEDGLVREVTVKTSKGVLRRDIRKICLLECSE